MHNRSSSEFPGVEYSDVVLVGVVFGRVVVEHGQAVVVVHGQAVVVVHGQAVVFAHGQAVVVEHGHGVMICSLGNCDG